MRDSFALSVTRHVVIFKTPHQTAREDVHLLFLNIF